MTENIPTIPDDKSKMSFPVAVKKLTGGLSNYRPPVKKPSLWENIKRINKSTTIKMPYWENIKRIANTNIIKTEDINKLVSPVVRKAALYTLFFGGLCGLALNSVQDYNFQKQSENEGKAFSSRLNDLEKKTKESSNFWLKRQIEGYGRDLNDVKENIGRLGRKINDNQDIVKGYVDEAIAKNKQESDAKYLGLEKVVSDTNKANELSTKELGKVVDDFYKEFVSFKDGFAKKPVKEEPKPLPEQKIATSTTTSWVGYLGQNTASGNYKKDMNCFNLGFADNGEYKLKVDFNTARKEEKKTGSLTTFSSNPTFAQTDYESFRTEGTSNIKSVDMSGKFRGLNLSYLYGVNSVLTKGVNDLETSITFTNPLLPSLNSSTDVQTRTKTEGKESLINVSYDLDSNWTGGLISKLDKTDVKAIGYVNGDKVIDYKDVLRTNGMGVSLTRNTTDNSGELFVIKYNGDVDKKENVDYAAHYVANLSNALNAGIGLNQFGDKHSYNAQVRLNDKNGVSDIRDTFRIDDGNNLSSGFRTKEQSDFYFLNSLAKKGTGLFVEKGDESWRAAISSEILPNTYIAAMRERENSNGILTLGLGGDLSESVTIGLYGQQTNYHEKLNNERIKKDNLIGININVKLGKGKGK